GIGPCTQVAVLLQLDSQAHACQAHQLRQPAACCHDHPPRRVTPQCGDDVDTVDLRLELHHGLLVPEYGAFRSRAPLHGGDGAAGCQHPGIGLIDGLVLFTEREGGEPGAHLVARQQLRGPSDSVESRLDDPQIQRTGVADVEATSPEQQPLARLLLEGQPRCIGNDGETHVHGVLVGVPEDARAAVRGTLVVEEAETLEQQRAPAQRQVHGSCAAYDTRPDHDGVVGVHAAEYYALPPRVNIGYTVVTY